MGKAQPPGLGGPGSADCHHHGYRRAVHRARLEQRPARPPRLPDTRPAAGAPADRLPGETGGARHRPGSGHRGPQRLYRLGLPVRHCPSGQRHAGGAARFRRVLDHHVRRRLVSLLRAAFDTGDRGQPAPLSPVPEALRCFANGGIFRDPGRLFPQASVYRRPHVAAFVLVSGTVSEAQRRGRLRPPCRHRPARVVHCLPTGDGRLSAGFPPLQSPHRGTARHRPLRPVPPRHAAGGLAGREADSADRGTRHPAFHRPHDCAQPPPSPAAGGVWRHRTGGGVGIRTRSALRLAFLRTDLEQAPVGPAESPAAGGQPGAALLCSDGRARGLLAADCPARQLDIPPHRRSAPPHILRL